jgi:hippurate hydrolase
MSSHSMNEMLAGLDDMRPRLTDFYRDLHRNPELSMQESHTAAKAAERLHGEGYEVTTGVGKTGVVAILDNGPGPMVMLRADMDALPLREQTGLPYASTAMGTDPDNIEVPVMHACGHDMHVACMWGAASMLATNRNRWSGRLMMVVQPGEEIAAGARAMIEDRIFDRFGKPTIILGQHVTPAPTGTLHYRSGVTMAAADSIEIRLFGRGAHGSRPQSSIDPVVMAASLVMRLQTIVAREVSPTEQVVVTVGSIRAGTKENIIPDEAFLKLNVRTFSPEVRERVLESIKRIANAEASASNAPRLPEFRPLNSFPILSNDHEATTHLASAFSAHFGEGRVHRTPAVNASEDFGEFGTAAGVPSVFWYFGGLDYGVIRAAERAGGMDAIPSNHSPLFAPVVEPTLSTGIEALVAGALAWLPAR